MAFNPLHRFRKHQKVILAVVTILLMIVFSLQWGSNDLLQQLTGGGRGVEPTANR